MAEKMIKLALVILEFLQTYYIQNVTLITGDKHCAFGRVGSTNGQRSKMDKQVAKLRMH